MITPVVELTQLYKTYQEGAQQRRVLYGAELKLQAGEFVLLMGRSGSGKSTLLNLISGIDQPDAGRVRVDGVELTAQSERDRTLFRRRRVGFIYQFFNLIPHLTVWENLMLPVELEGSCDIAAVSRGRQLLATVGLEDRSASFPDRLSGGEQQRVAIARALINDPIVLLADEPTGNLDEETGAQVLELIHALVRDGGHAVLMVTHGREAERYADRTLELRDGQVREVRRASVGG